jgi:hypothetical protein
VPQNGEMVDDESGIGVAVDQRRARIHVAPAKYVDRKVMLYARAENPVEARVIRLALCCCSSPARSPPGEILDDS